MKTVYAREPLEKSIFLAGPTPRKHTTTPSWRPEAKRILESFSWDGTLFIPEDRDGTCRFDYDEQVLWEWESLNQASVVLFWIPRDLDQMPAFTTNVEFGMFAHSRKVVLGFPTEAPKMSYLHSLAISYNIPVFHTLESSVRHAMMKCNFPFQKLS